jgi:hypothetical protein
MQPYLGEFLVRCVTPVQSFTVKIAAIEQQTRFRAPGPDKTPIGIELGADFAANVDLDDFMVFEQDRDAHCPRSPASGSRASPSERGRRRPLRLPLRRNRLARQAIVHYVP